MQVKGRRWKRARRHWVLRYWLEPLAWATAVAASFGAYMFLGRLTGFEGRRRTYEHTVAEAWRDVPMFAGSSS